MITNIFNHGIIILGASVKTMLLACVLHICFLPLVIHLVPLQETKTVWLAGIVLLIQMILFSFILGGIYLISILIFIGLRSRIDKYDTDQLCTILFPAIAIIYAAIFLCAYNSFGFKISFITASSLPHLIAVSAGLYVLVKDWKNLNTKTPAANQLL
jgi:hypothetical protein